MRLSWSCPQNKSHKETPSDIAYFRLEKAGLKAVNLPEEAGFPFPLQRYSVSLACAAFFPLSSFSLPFLSCVFQMSSLVWPRLSPCKRHCGKERPPQNAGAFAMIDISPYC